MVESRMLSLRCFHVQSMITFRIGDDAVRLAKYHWPCCALPSPLKLLGLRQLVRLPLRKELLVNPGPTRSRGLRLLATIAKMNEDDGHEAFDHG